MSGGTAGIAGIGDQFPDIALPTLDGGELHVSDLRGKKVLLFMWGSW